MQLGALLCASRLPSLDNNERLLLSTPNPVAADTWITSLPAGTCPPALQTLELHSNHLVPVAPPAIATATALCGLSLSLPTDSAQLQALWPEIQVS